MLGFHGFSGAGWVMQLGLNVNVTAGFAGVHISKVPGTRCIFFGWVSS